MSKTDLIKAIMAKYGRKLRTVQRWAKEIDLSDADAVERHWQAVRGRSKGSSLNAARRDIATPPTFDAKAVIAELKVDPTDAGAPANLRRLEAFEQKLAQRLDVALASGDPVAVNVARADYTNISETLRKLDIAVDQYRRDSKEVIEREQAEESVRIVAEYIVLGFNMWLSSEAPHLVTLKDPIKLTIAARRGFGEAFCGILKGSQKTRAPLPEWALSIVRKVLGE